VFLIYLYALCSAILWGHNSQEDELINDPELRNYYDRFEYERVKRPKVKEGSQSRKKSYFWHKDRV